MTYLIAAYLFLSVSSGITMVEHNTWDDWFIGMFAGLFWPFTFTAQVIRKIDSLLK